MHDGNEVIDLTGRPRDAGTAFVLAGGATRGASQVGMLQALVEAGIRADLVVGTSIGALNGACYAETPTLDGVERLARLWTDPPRSAIFSLSPRAIARNVRERRGYVLDNAGLADWIRVNTSVERLEDFPVPLHAVATDASTRRPVVLSRGDTVTSLLASSAIPGVFPPIVVDGNELVDGGVAADIPVAPAVGLGASTLYVLPTTPGDAAPPGRWWQLLDRLFGQPATPADHGTLHGVTVHVLPAPQPGPNPTSFRDSGRLMAEAYRLTRAHLDGSTDENRALPSSTGGDRTRR